jgi:hypothetical protein
MSRPILAFALILVLSGCAAAAPTIKVPVEVTRVVQLEVTREVVAVQTHVVVVTATPESAPPTAAPTLEPIATSTPTAMPEPTTVPEPTVAPTESLPPTVVPTEAPPVPDGPYATVFNGGNVRSQPHVRGSVLDQIHAGEYVQLKLHSVDGKWYRIVNARDVAGWVSASLLSVAPEMAAQVVPPAYRTLDVRELVKNPDRYKGTFIKMTGTVFNIDESGDSTYLQMWVQIPGGSQWDNEAVIVITDSALDGVYEDTAITVYSMGAGSQSGTNALGGTITQPVLVASYMMY